MDRMYTTPAGRQRLARKIELAHEAYLAVAATNEEANESGDSSVWHDNFAYEENQRQMHQLARRVRDLRQMFESLQVVEPPDAPDTVVLGCAVQVENEDGILRRYVISGLEDGDPDQERISYTAPLARALLGAGVGDVREVNIGGRRSELEVVAIDAARKGEV